MSDVSNKVLINGAGGFIGSHLVRSFLGAGYPVRAADMPGVDLGWAAQLGAETVTSSLENAESIDASVKGIGTVVHTAAIFDLACPRQKTLDVNINGTRYHCESAVRHGVKRFVLFSSVGVYGIPAANPCGENTMKNPRNAYEESKLLSEQCAMEFHKRDRLPVVAVRPTLVYGPGSKYGQAMYVTLFTALKYWGRNRMAIPAGGHLSHHVHVDDVVAAVRTLAEATGVEGKRFNVADEQALYGESVLNFLCETTGIQLTKLPGFLNPAMDALMRNAPGMLGGAIDGLNRRLAKSWKHMIAQYDLVPALQPKFDMGWLAYLYADHAYDTSALRALGWRPQHPHFLEGIQETVDWYRKNKWIPTREQLQIPAKRPA